MLQLAAQAITIRLALGVVLRRIQLLALPSLAEGLLPPRLRLRPRRTRSTVPHGMRIPWLRLRCSRT